MAEKKKVPTLDDILGAGRPKKPEDHIEAYGKFIRQKNKLDLENNQLSIAVNDGYNAMVEVIQGKIKDEADMVGKTEAEIYEVLSAYMEGFLKKASPAALKPLADLKDLKPKARYEYLRGVYGEVAGKKALQNIHQYEQTMKSQDGIEARDLKAMFRSKSKEHIDSALDLLMEKSYGMHIAHLDPGVYAKHLHAKAKEQGFEFKNSTKQSQFYSTPAEALIDFHGKVVDEDLSKNYVKHYGLIPKKEKDKK